MRSRTRMSILTTWVLHVRAGDNLREGCNACVHHTSHILHTMQGSAECHISFSQTSCQLDVMEIVIGSRGTGPMHPRDSFHLINIPLSARDVANPVLIYTHRKHDKETLQTPAICPSFWFVKCFRDPCTLDNPSSKSMRGNVQK